ncbi:MAG: type V CRISPR-associated protein Cas12b [Geobacter sp.]|nr:type V CRISPR-associated protein Cas12b [Geobacter sp.]
MPVRSLNLKLIVPRQQPRLNLAQDIWTTHVSINDATAYYESILLEMRGQGYELRDGVSVTDAEVVKRADVRIREVCKRNGRRSVLTKDELAEIRRQLRLLYEAIVPSSVGLDGNAQQANAFISPLTDPDSKGFLSVFDKIEAPPPWLEGVRNGESDAFDQATAWLRTPEGKRRLQATGSPPTWVRKVRKGEKDWPVAFVADYDKKLNEVKGVPTIIKTLKEQQVIPLFSAYLAPRIAGARGALSPWDRLAFRLAVGHLLSWESWCRLAQQEHQNRVNDLESFTETRLCRTELSQAIAALRRYEEERHEELSSIGLAPGKPFRIRRRMVRCWTELREKWQASKDKTEEKLLSISAEMQTKQRGGFGDPHLFTWLARPENHAVWSTGPDAVSLVATGNLLQSIVDRSKEQAAMTLPDPILHPRSLQWEPVGGSNLKNYRLYIKEGRVMADLPLLSGNGESLTEVEHTFALAANAQFSSPAIDRNGKSIAITFQNQAGEAFSGVLNSADLLMDWDHLSHRTAPLLASGEVGPVWLKLVIDVDQQLQEGWDGRRPQALIHFTSARGNEKRAGEVRPGLRILSVDLGIRSFAACSVFELTNIPPKKGKLAFEVEGGLCAVHERSFLLNLPGEQQEAQDIVWRQLARDELRRLKRGLSRYRGIYELASLQSPEERTVVLDRLSNASEATDPWPFERPILAGLEKVVEYKPDKWEAQVKSALHGFRREYGEVVREWRHRTRPRSETRSHGKSVWAIEYLTDVRRFLQGWTLLGEGSGDIRRLDREKRGKFAGRLLRHLESVKDDRLKTGADLIVQAARGYLRDDTGNWQPKYASCHAVLFEDLSRYRMKTDRPRRENSLLMRWAHRQIPDIVKMQGEIYGIHTCDTAAAFTSRYHAATGTPGIRCHPLTEADLANPWLRQIIEQENPAISWDSQKPGSLVPLAGGELFVCLNKHGGLTSIHADINAAQNLQRRFWTRHGDPIRIPCRKVIINGEDRWLPKNMAKRLYGALGGYGWLVPTGHDSGSCRWEKLTPKAWKAVGGEAPQEESAGDELLSEDVMETTGEVVVMFRDPSGVAVKPHSLWFPAKYFWSIVKSRTTGAILK